MITFIQVEIRSGFKTVPNFVNWNLRIDSQYLSIPSTGVKYVLQMDIAKPSQPMVRELRVTLEFATYGVEEHILVLSYKY